ncbi:MAG TPA: carbon monoxide dehydrogenase [Chloroflexi bacterium]|nr:carbon monoxide dehydrogenase [Chloroflexota bacterium]
MILDNQVEINATPRAVFDAIRDPARIISCLPGAQLDSSDGATHQGRIKVKVGPITAQYSGVVEFTEIDDAQLTMRLTGRGDDVHGSGDAEAAVEIRVTDAAGGALLLIHSDVVIRGKIAQFGKSAINAVANVILNQFAMNLSKQLAGSTDGTESTAASGLPARLTGNGATLAPPAFSGVAAENQGLDVVSVFVLPLVRRYAGPLICAVVGGLIGFWISRRPATPNFRHLLEYNPRVTDYARLDFARSDDARAPDYGLNRPLPSSSAVSPASRLRRG